MSIIGKRIDFTVIHNQKFKGSLSNRAYSMCYSTAMRNLKLYRSIEEVSCEHYSWLTINNYDPGFLNYYKNSIINYVGMQYPIQTPHQLKGKATLIIQHVKNKKKSIFIFKQKERLTSTF